MGIKLTDHVKDLSELFTKTDIEDIFIRQYRSDDMSLVDKYKARIIFEEVEVEGLSASKLDDLELEYGVYVPSKTTPLWIIRKLEVMGVLGTPTIMENTSEFDITDSFGFTMFTGTSGVVVDYVKGFVLGVTEE